MEDVRNNFFIQVLHGTTRDRTQLPFINKEELAGNEIINGSIGCSDHEVDYEDPAVSEEGKQQNKVSGLQVIKLWLIQEAGTLPTVLLPSPPRPRKKHQTGTSSGRAPTLVRGWSACPVRTTGGPRFVQPREETASRPHDSSLPGLLRRSWRRRSQGLDSGAWLDQRFVLETSWDPFQLDLF